MAAAARPGLRTAAVPVAPVSAVTPPAQAEGRRPASERPASRADRDRSGVRAVTVPIADLADELPESIRDLVLALGAVALLALVGFGISALRAHRAERRSELLSDELGHLESALLPAPAGALGGLEATLAYRAAEGPAAGGDFYDAFRLRDGRACLILGDVSGHGRPALADTAQVRYTLRAYLEAGLEPRAAVELAGNVLEPHVAGFATVVAAVHDQSAGTLTYASAGHPPPIVLDPEGGEPVTVLSSPPLGVGRPTGLRQTTLPLPAGTLVCFYTDGLAESRVGGEMLGRDGIRDLLASLGPGATASALLREVAREADRTPDDMAACVLRASAPTEAAAAARVEEVELDAREIEGGDVERFLRECGIAAQRGQAVLAAARSMAAERGSAVLRLSAGEGAVERPVRAEAALAAVGPGGVARGGAPQDLEVE